MSNTENTTNNNENTNMIELQSVSDSEIVAVLQTEEKLSPKSYGKWLFWLILVVVLLVLSAITIGFVVAFGAVSTNPPQAKYTAQQQIGYILEQIAYNESNITEYMDELHATFDVFDANNDDVWNNEELSDYLQSISSSDDVFHVMDINGDDILSYREIVAIFIELDKVSLVSGHIKAQFSFVIEEIYNDSYVDDESNMLWFQRVADLFLKFYDSEYNGYISYDAYYDVYANKYFDSFDLNNDNVIDFDEFISDTFNADTITELSNFGFEHITELQAEESNFIEIISKLNESTVNAIELDYSYNYGPQSMNERRRLQVCGGGDCALQTQCIVSGSHCAAEVVVAAICIGVTFGSGSPACVLGAVAVCAQAAIDCVAYTNSVTLAGYPECYGKDHCVCVANLQTYSLRFTLECADGSYIGQQADITNGLQKCVGYMGECSSGNGHPYILMEYYDAWFLWTTMDCDNNINGRTDNKYRVYALPSNKGVSLQTGIHPDGGVENTCSSSQGALINTNLYITELGKHY